MMNEVEGRPTILIRPAEQIVNYNHGDDITLMKKVLYGVGNYYNGLCSSMWFTYFMIFLEKVLQLENSKAGLLMLIGHMVDAISTPLIGFLCDSKILPKIFDRLGRRISWHAIGVICITLSFSMIFNKCLLCDSETSDWHKVIWFIPFVALFQFGWACVQISHLSLIPELSSVSSSRSTMSSLRTAVAVLANLTVNVTLYLLLSSRNADHSTVGPWNFDDFRTASVIFIFIGLVVSVVFYTSTEQKKIQPQVSRTSSVVSISTETVSMEWKSWFKRRQFYQVAVLYMLTRLYINISLVYFPFYITESQNLDKKYTAILPFTSYLSSFVVSLLSSLPFASRFSKKILYAIGLIIGMSASVVMLSDLPGWRIFVLAGTLGTTQTILLICSLSITADMIDRNTETSAFVYGAMSFLGKLCNGVVYQVIELINPTKKGIQPAIGSDFYRNILVFVPGTILFCAFLTILTLIPSEMSNRRVLPTEDDEVRLIAGESDNSGSYPEI